MRVITALRVATTDGVDVFSFEDVLHAVGMPNIKVLRQGVVGSYATVGVLMIPFFIDNEQYVLVKDKNDIQIYEFPFGTILDWAVRENFAALVVTKNGHKYVETVKLTGKNAFLPLQEKRPRLVKNYLSKHGLIVSVDKLGATIIVPGLVNDRIYSTQISTINDIAFDGTKYAVSLNVGVVENVFGEPTLTLMSGPEKIGLCPGGILAVKGSILVRSFGKKKEEYQLPTHNVRGDFARFGETTVLPTAWLDPIKNHLVFYYTTADGQTQVLNSQPLDNWSTELGLLDASVTDAGLTYLVKLNNSLLMVSKQSVEQYTLEDALLLDAKFAGREPLVVGTATTITISK